MDLATPCEFHRRFTRLFSRCIDTAAAGVRSTCSSNTLLIFQPLREVYDQVHASFVAELRRTRRNSSGRPAMIPADKHVSGRSATNHQ
jgi:hypothetical protein